MTRHISCFTYPLFPDEELTFIHPDDAELFNAWDSRAFEVQVANHELLGHGSGKLFKEDASGTKNFDPDKVSSASLKLRQNLGGSHKLNRSSTR